MKDEYTIVDCSIDGDEPTFADTFAEALETKETLESFSGKQYVIMRNGRVVDDEMQIECYREDLARIVWECDLIKAHVKSLNQAVDSLNKKYGIVEHRRRFK